MIECLICEAQRKEIVAIKVNELKPMADGILRVYNRYLYFCIILCLFLFCFFAYRLVYMKAVINFTFIIRQKERRKTLGYVIVAGIFLFSIIN